MTILKNSDSFQNVDGNCQRIFAQQAKIKSLFIFHYNYPHLNDLHK
jgi:hypothetical protein